MSPSKAFEAESGKHTKKDKKKKKKRKKDKVSSDDEDDEDIQALHVVNTDIGEMPEGAQLSDPDDFDNRPEDDPHRALDIDLDEYGFSFLVNLSDLHGNHNIYAKKCL